MLMYGETGDIVAISIRKLKQQTNNKSKSEGKNGLKSLNWSDSEDTIISRV